MAASSANTALSNPVLALFGHAVARNIAGDPRLVKATNQRGKRWLTQQSRETRQGEAPQYGWIKYRHVSLDEIWPVVVDKRPQADFARLEDLFNTHGIVHAVVTNVEREDFVVTNYFVNAQASDFKTFVKERLFELLDDDDPDIIADVVADPAFEAFLRADFESGDTRDSAQRVHHTLSKMKAPMNLLHHCCENNFPDCVKLLLDKFAPGSAQEPWLVLAEPTLWVDKWRNTAFHSAAYRGNLECLRHLLSWASRERVVITELLDSKSKSALEIARDRGNIECFNLLAPLFGETPLGIESAPRGVAGQLMMIDFAFPGGDSRVEFEVSALGLLDMVEFLGKDMVWRIHASQCGAQGGCPGALLNRVVHADTEHVVWDANRTASSLPDSLRALGETPVRAVGSFRLMSRLGDSGLTFKDLAVELRSRMGEVHSWGGEVQSSLVYGIDFAPDERTDEEDILALLQLLRNCHTVTLNACVCGACATLFLCRGIRSVLPSSSWRRLFVFPSCRASGEEVAAFAEELPLLLSVLRRSPTLEHMSRSRMKSVGMPMAPVPRHLRAMAGAVSTSLDVNRFVTMKKRAALEAATPAARSAQKRGFFASGVLKIWRHMLDMQKLVQAGATSVDEALDPGATGYVREWLLNLGEPLQGQCGEVVREELGLSEADFGEMLEDIDFAVWALLRMHRLLPEAPRLAEELLPSWMIPLLKKAGPYAKQKGWWLAERRGDTA